MNLWRKILLVAFIAAFIGCFITWCYLLGSFHLEPKVPNLATHNIVPINLHGSIHYITPLQDFLLHWLVPMGFSLQLLLAFIFKDPILKYLKSHPT